MSPVDHLHQLVRHTCADHKRETLAFGRRLESVLARLTLIAVWRNFLKGRSERKPDRTTPAMRLGLAKAPWTWERLLSRRLFPNREHLSPSGQQIYQRTLTPKTPTHSRRHAH